MTTILIIYGSIVVIGLITIIILILRAPVGYEDGTGFHFGESK